MLGSLVRHRLPYHPVRDKVDTINNIETCHLYCGTFPSRPRLYLLLSSHMYVECPPLHHELSPTQNNAHLPRSEDKLLTHPRSIQPKHIRRNKPDIFRPKWEARPQMAHHPSDNQTHHSQVVTLISHWRGISTTCYCRVQSPSAFSSFTTGQTPDTFWILSSVIRNRHQT